LPRSQEIRINKDAEVTVCIDVNEVEFGLASVQMKTSRNSHRSTGSADIVSTIGLGKPSIAKSDVSIGEPNNTPSSKQMARGVP
jgi:hypothetical protein